MSWPVPPVTEDGSMCPLPGLRTLHANVGGTSPYNRTTPFLIRNRC